VRILDGFRFSVGNMTRSLVEEIYRRDRVVVGGALGVLVLMAWLYTIRASTDMRYMSAGYAFWMWAVMMVAMMTPSAAPMVLAFSRMSRPGAGVTGAFLLGYLALWTGFSFLAAAAQALLERATLLSPMGASTSPVLSAVVLLAAGLYQFSPWKYACLSKCRAPLGFLMTEWREGWTGALVMGLRHGLYCAGCCWLLMALLFVAGVMNLAWIAALTLIVLAEKVFGRWVSNLVGAAAVVCSVWLLLSR
jgi:predicted metal-binding membrane protein